MKKVVKKSAATKVAEAGSVDLQHTWYELERARPWKSLALVCAEEGGSIMAVAEAVADMAGRDPNRRVVLVNAELGAEEFETRDASQNDAGAAIEERERYGLLDYRLGDVSAEDIGMVEVPRLLAAVHDGQSPYTTSIVALSSPLTSAATAFMTRAVDAVVLCVFLGKTGIMEARRIVELIGKDKLLGTIVVRPGPASAASK